MRQKIFNILSRSTHHIVFALVYSSRLLGRVDRSKPMERLDHSNLDFEQLSLHCSKFIQDLVMFVMENMHNEMEFFFKEHCRDVDSSDETHSHKYWALFQEYQELLEGKLEIFVSEQKLTAKTLFKKLEEAQAENEMASAIVQYLLGATDYERFVDLLLDRQLYFYGSGVEDPEKLFQENLRKKDEAGMKTTGSGDEGSIYEGGKLADGDSCAESDDGDHAQLKK